MFKRSKWDNIVSYVGRDYVEYRRPDGSTFELRNVQPQFSPQNKPREQAKVDPQGEAKVLPLYKRIEKGAEYNIQTEDASYDKVQVTSVGSGSVILAYQRSTDPYEFDGSEPWPGSRDPKLKQVVETVKLASITGISRR